MSVLQIGFGELLVVLILALLLIKPEQMPDLARALLRLLHSNHKLQQSVHSQLNQIAHRKYQEDKDD